MITAIGAAKIVTLSIIGLDDGREEFGADSGLGGGLSNATPDNTYEKINQFFSRRSEAKVCEYRTYFPILATQVHVRRANHRQHCGV